MPKLVIYRNLLTIRIRISEIFELSEKKLNTTDQKTGVGSIIINIQKNFEKINNPKSWR